MSDAPTRSELDILRDLDRIRDTTLELAPLCRSFCRYLGELGFDEAHLLVRDEESGGLANPAPDQPLSQALQVGIETASGGEMEAGPDLLLLTLRPRSRDLGLLALRTFGPMTLQMRRAGELAASVIDSAVEHALSHTKLQQRNRELEAIFALDRLRDSHLPFDQMLDRAGQAILEFIPADTAVVVLLNKSNDAVDIRFPSSVDCRDISEPDGLRAIKRLAEQAFALRSLVSAGGLHPAIGSALCVPLILDEDIIGAFAVLKRASAPFTADTRRLLSAMASQIDTAIFENIERQRIKGVFSRYVSAEVVEEMLRTDCDFFAGQRRELTVLFSDLRGFTAASERLDTDTLVRMLNEHLRAMTEVVLQHRGTLDKFIGDCVMAFWGAPVGQPDHALLAVRAAVAMRQAHQSLLARWQAEGLPEIHVGIGLNTGDVFVGNIGDERRTSYTVIGDHVNLASRLEGVARGGEVLITASTFDRVRDRVAVSRMEPVRVKGKRDPIELYDVARLR